MAPAFLLLVLLAAEPAPIPLAATGFTAVGLRPELAASYSETFALRLNQTGLVKVMTPRDVQAVVGAERQRQLLGCTDDSSSCIAELAGALGAEALVVGDLTQVGATLQLTVKVVDARDARVLFATLERLKTEEEVLDVLDRLARVAAERVHTVLRPGVPLPRPVLAAPAPPKSKAPLALVGVGAAAVVGGAVAWGLAAADYQALTVMPSPVPDLPSARALGASGAQKQLVGLSLLGGGAAVAVAGLLWYALQPAAAPVPAVSVLVGPSGVYVGVQGAL